MAKELDNMKMWASLIKYSKVSWVTTMLKKALKDQGFEFKDGEIISIKTDPCDGCKMASGGCALTCRKLIEYYKISGQKQELSHSEPTKKSDQELTEFEKTVEPKFKIGDTVTVKPMSCHGKVFKGEPFKIVDIIEDNYVSDDGKTYSISLQDGWELVEQKPAWSEKDEKQRRQIERIVSIDGCTKKLQKQIHYWFESLKDRVQPKQEWSKEDEQYLLVCKNALAKYQVSDKWDANIISRWLENRLKSFRPQNTWKPCDEQMHSLKQAINAFPYETDDLESLYEQLKKLREE